MSISAEEILQDKLTDPLDDPLKDPLKDAVKEPLKPKTLSPEHIKKLRAGKRAYHERIKNMTPSERARLAMDHKFNRIMAEFLDAALGQGKFEGLDKRTQAALLVKAMEWNIGRPNTGKPIVEEKPEPEKIGVTFE